MVSHRVHSSNPRVDRNAKELKKYGSSFGMDYDIIKADKNMLMQKLEEMA